MLLAVGNRVRARGDWETTRSAHSADEDLALRGERDGFRGAAGGASQQNRKDHGAVGAELGHKRARILETCGKRGELAAGRGEIRIDGSASDIRIARAVHGYRAHIDRKSTRLNSSHLVIS